jgi:hypothetical protein
MEVLVSLEEVGYFLVCIYAILWKQDDVWQWY